MWYFLCGRSHLKCLGKTGQSAVPSGFWTGLQKLVASLAHFTIGFYCEVAWITHTIAGNGTQGTVGMSMHLPKAGLEIFAASSFGLRRCSGSQMPWVFCLGRRSVHGSMPAPLACSEPTSIFYSHLPIIELSREAELRLSSPVRKCAFVGRLVSGLQKQPAVALSARGGVWVGAEREKGKSNAEMTY